MRTIGLQDIFKEEALPQSFCGIYLERVQIV